MEESLDKYAELYDEAWERFQRTREKEPAGIGTRHMPTLRTGPGGPGSKSGSILKRPPPKAHGPARSHLQRVPLPYFSGKVEEWPEFRRYFNELTKDEHFPPGIMMAQIREHLQTKEAKALIAGKTNPKGAWTALNKRYGDKELVLVNVRHKVASLDTSRG